MTNWKVTISIDHELYNCGCPPVSAGSVTAGLESSPAESEWIFYVESWLLIPSPSTACTSVWRCNTWTITTATGPAAGWQVYSPLASNSMFSIVRVEKCLPTLSVGSKGTSEVSPPSNFRILHYQFISVHQSLKYLPTLSSRCQIMYAGVLFPDVTLQVIWSVELRSTWISGPPTISVIDSESNYYRSIVKDASWSPITVKVMILFIEECFGPEIWHS